MSTVSTEIPERLLQQAQVLVQSGWANNIQELMVESLRRYVESHQDALTEQFIRDDVVWGLNGLNNCPMSLILICRVRRMIIFIVLVVQDVQGNKAKRLP